MSTILLDSTPLTHSTRHPLHNTPITIYPYPPHPLPHFLNHFTAYYSLTPLHVNIIHSYICFWGSSRGWSQQKSLNWFLFICVLLCYQFHSYLFLGFLKGVTTAEESQFVSIHICTLVLLVPQLSIHLSCLSFKFSIIQHSHTDSILSSLINFSSFIFAKLPRLFSQQPDILISHFIVCCLFTSTAFTPAW